MRSKSRLGTSPKVHLCDPSIGPAALGVSAERLAARPGYFGQVFESMVIRNLRALASANDGTVYHYRDNTGLEIDAISEYWDDSWAGIEVKLGSTEIPTGEANLLKLRDERVNTDTVGQPRFMAVITGTELRLHAPQPNACDSTGHSRHLSFRLTIPEFYHRSAVFMGIADAFQRRLRWLDIQLLAGRRFLARVGVGIDCWLGG